MARLVPFFEYDEQHFFASDSAPEAVSRQRHQAFTDLAARLQQQAPLSIAFSESLDSSIPDVRFTSAYRVPFPYRNYVRRYLKLASVAEETAGVCVKDLDGNWRFDLTGAYGVNVFGYDFYKACMEEGWQMVRHLGPVLGPYHPVIRDNVERLKAISGLDEVSFHMSGTEAVMQAVRMARYHTGRTHLVMLCGAYHGWWDGVQPGVGGERKADDIYMLRDMHEATLRVLETRDDIACVLVNPLQSLHPNAGAASDGSLIASDRKAAFNRETYTAWLQRIREVCTRRGIVLIFDEVFTGFRLAYRGAQEYFGVQADLVTYGKTLGGGLPVGVLCGSHALMKRFRDDRPLNISFARGTFNSHPFVMAAMNVFLRRIEAPEFQQQYAGLDAQWNERAECLNRRLEEAGIPVRIAHLVSIWTILYTRPSRYNWMYQYYLRAEGIALSWVGSGRVIMSHNFSDGEFEEVIGCFVRAGQAMLDGGWWWHGPQLTDKAIKRQLLWEMVTARLPLLAHWWRQPLPQAEPTGSADHD
jgi:glutamate-1-semialdehyde 2,1-aminomutase